MITLVTDAGLANRIRAISSARCLADEMRRVSIRPCPASTVSARLRSGGSRGLPEMPGSAATLEGGIVAGGVGNFSFEFGLVAPRSGRGQAFHE